MVELSSNLLGLGTHELRLTRTDERTMTVDDRPASSGTTSARRGILNVNLGEVWGRDALALVPQIIAAAERLVQMGPSRAQVGDVEIELADAERGFTINHPKGPVVDEFTSRTGSKAFRSVIGRVHEGARQLPSSMPGVVVVRSDLFWWGNTRDDLEELAREVVHRIHDPRIAAVILYEELVGSNDDWEVRTSAYVAGAHVDDRWVQRLGIAIPLPGAANPLRPDLLDTAFRAFLGWM